MPLAKLPVPSIGSTTQTGARAGQRMHHVGILGGCFLAHHDGAGQDFEEAGRQRQFGGFIGDGDEIAWRFLARVAFLQIAEARQDLDRGHLADEVGDSFRVEAGTTCSLAALQSIRLISFSLWR